MSPTVKALIIGYAFIVNSAVLIWAGIQLYATNLGLSTDWYNIGLVIVTTLNLGASGMLAFLGLRAPVIEE